MANMSTSDKAKDARLRKIYKKTLAQKNKEIEEQGGGCAICGRPFPLFTPQQDHDHACCPRRLKEFCGKCNRSWLCYLCNKWAIGGLEYMAKVNIPAEKAFQYLKDWHEKIKMRGGYEPKEKGRKVRRKRKSIR